MTTFFLMIAMLMGGGHPTPPRHHRCVKSTTPYGPNVCEPGN
jgi:hypothetical protein